MAPTYKLYYFNAMGRAEISRMLLAQAGAKYEDHRIEKEDWPEFKKKMPFGQLPVLEVDGVLIAQSCAIERLIAREHGLYGNDSMESALCDMIVDSLSEVMDHIRKLIAETNTSKKLEMKQHFLKEILPIYAKSFENLLIKNGTGYIVGNSITWADITLAAMMAFIELKSPGALKGRSTIGKHAKKILELPNIKRWLKERPKTPT